MGGWRTFKLSVGGLVLAAVLLTLLRGAGTKRDNQIGDGGEQVAHRNKEDEHVSAPSKNEFPLSRRRRELYSHLPDEAFKNAPLWWIASYRFAKVDPNQPIWPVDRNGNVRDKSIYVTPQEALDVGCINVIEIGFGDRLSATEQPLYVPGPDGVNRLWRKFMRVYRRHRHAPDFPFSPLEKGEIEKLIVVPADRTPLGEEAFLAMQAIPEDLYLQLAEYCVRNPKKVRYDFEGKVPANKRP